MKAGDPRLKKVQWVGGIAAVLLALATSALIAGWIWTGDMRLVKTAGLTGGLAVIVAIIAGAAEDPPDRPPIHLGGGWYI